MSNRKHGRIISIKPLALCCWNFTFDDNICDTDALELYLTS